MATPILQRIAQFFRSPQGKRVIDQARRTAQRPETRRQLSALLNRWRRGGHR